jgi:hypothetical protein
MTDPKPVQRKTSDYLRQVLDHASGDFPNAFAQMAMAQTRMVWEMIAPMLLDQYEGIAHFEEDGAIVGPKEVLSVALDDYLCRKFVADVPTIAERVMRLDRLVTLDDPSPEVHNYFRQAMRCYVMGIPLAAAALSRACLEQAMRERVPYATSTMMLDTLITAAGRFRTLDVIQLQLADDVRTTGNEVMHKGACADEEAFGIILKVRALVEALYGAAPEGNWKPWEK